tara:strand:- start:533 stop:1276 length:744 start_codon:yes stop_codon:yes gene_type:complete
MNLKTLRKKLKKDFKIFYKKSTNSTMKDANIFYKKNKTNLIMLADKQTNGIGRRGNKWISTPGNIYCSLALNIPKETNEYFFLSLIVLISVKKTISKFGNHDVLFKWPNDFIYDNKKFGGIIIETKKTINNNTYVIIGLGLNFSNSPLISNYKTTFIKNIIKIKNKYYFLEEFFENFIYYFNNFKFKEKEILSEFKNSLVYLNKNVTINIDNNNSVRGIIKGINKDGSLKLKVNKKNISIYSGSMEI